MKPILILFLALCAFTVGAVDMCVEIKPPQVRAIKGVGRMWGETSTFWRNGTVINIGWMGGTSRQREAAWKRFQMLDNLTGLTLTRNADKEAQVRVSFDPKSGHWSYVGKDCLNIAKGKPTMNLALTAGIFGDTAEEWDRVALHEGCHMLGMHHEHQHPKAGIPWDVPRVIARYKAQQGWSEREIRWQVIDRYKGNEFNGTAFDKTSIMQYAVDADLTLNGFSVGWNTKLSPSDIVFLKKIYP